MQRWTSEPLDVDLKRRFERVDLEFERVAHDGPTFTVLAYLNNPDVPDDAGRDEDRNFAGAFTVFAHGDCWGDVGHCEPLREPVSPFDFRPEHALTPANFTLEVTDAVRRLADADPLRVTLLVTTAAPGVDEPLRFGALTAVVYE